MKVWTVINNRNCVIGKFEYYEDAVADMDRYNDANIDNNLSARVI